MLNPELANRILDIMIKIDGPHVDSDIGRQLKCEALEVLSIFNEMREECPAWFELRMFGYGTSGHIRLLAQHKFKAQLFLNEGGFVNEGAKLKYL